ncbi:MAG: hypothetical protein LQ340_007743 [Diploschistes diacapsis]|nr:MAG: hypothetical protein LQ340_007743 [Diploschistes diacapsis]
MASVADVATPPSLKVDPTRGMAVAVVSNVSSAVATRALELDGTVGELVATKLEAKTDIEKPTEVKVAVVVGEANKMLVGGTAAVGAELRDAASEVVVDKTDVEAIVKLVTVESKIEESAEVVGRTAELGEEAPLEPKKLEDTEVAVGVEVNRFDAALETVEVGRMDGAVEAATELPMVCKLLAGTEVALGFSKDWITDDPDVIVSIVGTGIDTMLCEFWFLFPRGNGVDPIERRIANFPRLASWLNQ